MMPVTDTNTTDQTRKLEFASEAGSARSKWVAGILSVALVAWMGSGYLIPSHDTDAHEETKSREVAPVAVSVRSSVAEQVTHVFSAEGQGQPDRRTPVRSEASALVTSIEVGKGRNLEEGDLIARLSSTDLEARLEQANQELDRAQRDFDNSVTLRSRGVATTDRVTEARADLASARAQVASAEKALENTEIRAPFAGRLDALGINVGEFVQAGTEVGVMLDSDPLTIEIQVPQQSVGSIQEGQPAEVTFVTGERRLGEVIFVGADANTETRTFPAEIRVPNPDHDLPSGLSAQVRIPTGEMRAHFVSPAVLSLDTDGVLGVKTVDARNMVSFLSVKVERAQVDGLWISGLPHKVDIITVGQGFVRDGEVVAPSKSTMTEATEIAAEVSQ